MQEPHFIKKQKISTNKFTSLLQVRQRRKTRIINHAYCSIQTINRCN